MKRFSRFIVLLFLIVITGCGDKSDDEGIVQPPEEPPDQTAPVITSTPPETATEGQLYTYQITATDSDGDELVYTLVIGPAGMSIDPVSGLVSWTPQAIDVGIHEVELLVSDNRGGETTQSYKLQVYAALDRVPPLVLLIIPSEALAGGILTVIADPRDDTAIAGVSFYIDNLLVLEDASPPFDLVYNVPATPGATIAVRVVAVDPAGNAGEATATVLITTTADTTPPEITRFIHPPSASAGESLTVLVEATDNRGIAEVRFSQDGNVFATDSTPPYEGSLTVPAMAVGSNLEIVAEAADFAGNTATAQGVVEITALPDGAPPTNVTITAPAQALAGQEIELQATAVDNVGVRKVSFLADGVLVTEDSEAPFTASYQIPANKPVGSQVVFQVRAVDFFGNETESPLISTSIVSAGEGFVLGEVYDDSTGLPLVGVSVAPMSEPVAVVQALSLSTSPSGGTDAQGRFYLRHPEGDADVVISRDGYTTAYRTQSVPRDAVTSPLDVRLNPLGEAHVVNNLSGRNILIDDGNIGLYVAPGTFIGETTALYVQKISAQALPASLPLGWAPRCGVYIGPDVVQPNTALELTIRGRDNLGAGEAAIARLVAVTWDVGSRRWIRLAADTDPQAGVARIAVARPGTILLIRPDSDPAAPEIPSVGEAVTGVAYMAMPGGITADILPSPRILFMEPGARSEVRVRLNNAQPLPSGSRLQVQVDETYERTDGSRLMPPVQTQDIVLYQRETGLEGQFIVSPSQQFDPTLLREGVIILTALGPEVTDSTAVIGPAGGTVSTPTHATLKVPAGAATDRIPVTLLAAEATAPGLTGDGRYTWLAGVHVGFGGAVLSSAAELSLQLDGSIAADTQLLAVRIIDVSGVTQLELVGVAALNGTVATVGAGGQGLPLPGIRQGGDYHLLLMNQPVAFVTGTVQSGAEPAVDAMVGIDTLPFVSRTETTAPEYVVASTLGESILSGEDISTGAGVTADASVQTLAEIAVVNLNLATTRPTVISMAPADGATDVPVAASVSVRFSRIMDPETINASTFKLYRNGQELTGDVSLQPDGRTAVFRPHQPLQDDAGHRIVLAAALLDIHGQALLGNQPDESYLVAFTTIDLTPPARPEAGQVSVQYSDVNQLEITGTQGSSEPGDVISASNEVTGTTVTVISEADGSYSFTIPAVPGENVLVLYSDAAGNQTSVPVELPVVPISISASPSSLLFLALNGQRALSVTANYSDGSSTVLTPEDAAYLGTDDQVFTISQAAIVTSIGDGAAELQVAYGEAPYRQTITVTVEVKTTGTVLFDQPVGPEGVDIRHDNGFGIYIPEGGLATEQQLVIEEIILDAPLVIDTLAIPVAVKAVYRIEPSVELAAVARIEFPLIGVGDGGPLPDEEFIALLSSTGSIDDIEVGGIRTEDKEDYTPQHMDRLNNLLVVHTTHFSTWLIATTEIAGGVVAAGRNLQRVEIDYGVGNAKTPMFRVPPVAGTNTNDANSRRYVVLHATQPTIAISSNVDFRNDPTPWANQDVWLRVCGNNCDYRDDALWNEAEDPDQDHCTFLHPKLNRNDIVQPVVEKTIPGNQILRLNLQRVEQIYTKSATQIRFGIYRNRPDDPTIPGPASADGPLSDTHCPPVPLDDRICEVEITIEDLFDPAQRVSPCPNNNITINWGRPVTSTAKKEIASWLIDNRLKTAFAVGRAGAIYKFTNSGVQTNHAPGNNELSDGIEILNTSHALDFYSGPQMDAVVHLLDGLLFKNWSLILGSGIPADKERNRKEDGFATEYRLPDERPDRFGFVQNPPLDESWPVVTHREADRDRNQNADGTQRSGGSAGTGYRKADPYGDFEMQYVDAGLAYDFPGLIDTSGGDLVSISGNNSVGNGGDVVIKYGFRPDDDLDDPWDGFQSTTRIDNEVDDNDRLLMRGSAFAAISSVDGLDRRNERVDHLDVPENQTRTLAQLLRTDDADPQNDIDPENIGNVWIKGTLLLESDTVIRTSGTFYLDPKGRIHGQDAVSGDGFDLTVYSAGPVLLHGHLDLSGRDWLLPGLSAGSGGQLKVLSRARSPLQIPTIVTAGGDVQTMDASLDSSQGRGGGGGDVYIQGPPRGVLVFSGLKRLPRTPVNCNPELYSQGVNLYPINFLPGRLYESGFMQDGDCYWGTSDYNPNKGLAKTHGRGIITSGGMGASLGRLPPDPLPPIKNGAPGGDGGNIHIEWAGGFAGMIRFRDVAFLTGAGSGTVKSQTPVTFYPHQLSIILDKYLSDPTDVPLLQFTGGSGGKGSTGYKGISGSAGVLFFQHGGDGGMGGKAGNVHIAPNSTIYPSVDWVQTNPLMGHDGGIPKDDPLIPIGSAVTFIHYVPANVGPPTPLKMLTFAVRTDIQAGETDVLLGGSGGLVGGSLSGAALDFDRTGTSGTFGRRGHSGTLEMPFDDFTILLQGLSVSP